MDLFNHHEQKLLYERLMITSLIYLNPKRTFSLLACNKAGQCNSLVNVLLSNDKKNIEKKKLIILFFCLTFLVEWWI